MRVEILGKKLNDSGFSLTKGDTVTVPDDVGARWCSYGWAKDADGVVPTGERKPGARALEVQDAIATTGGPSNG